MYNIRNCHNIILVCVLVIIVSVYSFYFLSLELNLDVTNISKILLQRDWPKCLPTPSSLYKLCALLLHEGLVRLSDLYAHVSQF